MFIKHTIPRYQVVKKPDLTVMTLLSRLPGVHRVPLQMSGVPPLARLSGMASTGRSCTSVMLIRSDNTAPNKDGPLGITLDFGQQDLPLQWGAAANMTVAHWQLDTAHGNPYAAWLHAGSPQWPSASQQTTQCNIAALRQNGAKPSVLKCALHPAPVLGANRVSNPGSVIKRV